MNDISQLAHIAPPTNVELSAENADAEVDVLRGQLWTGLMIVTLLMLVITRVVRTLWGDSPNRSWVSVALLATLGSVILANLLLRKTKYAPPLRTIFTLILFLVTPVVLVLFGGTRGFGDLALFSTVMVSLLHGLRRWMIVTGGIIVIVLIYIFYRDSTGQPITPLISYSSQFTSLKFAVSMSAMMLITWFGNSFYRKLLAKYRNTALQLSVVNDELQAKSTQLEQLTVALQSSRQNIVGAREEERRRLRRDLHDGLGPTLAAQIFRIGIASTLVPTQPNKAVSMLAELEDGIRDALSDLRRLVYDLRPPSLDQLGLLGAIEVHTDKVRGQIEIDLSLPDHLDEVDAAAEVAVFRIVQTSLDNVMAHAHAQSCRVSLVATADKLTLTVIDDGVGLPENNAEGVGITSMRERTEEVGGTFTIAKRHPNGTRLQAQIPIGAPALSN